MPKVTVRDTVADGKRAGPLSSMVAREAAVRNHRAFVTPPTLGVNHSNLVA